jgi:hypothetical protein
MKRTMSLTFFLAIFLSGCAVLKTNATQKVLIEDGVKFSYSGRGAGAGVALMSTMGPAGIAVGVAIDEGIRKDLEASANSAGFDIVKLVSNSDLTGETITITGYGMQDIPGGDDKMFPYIDLVIVENSEEKVVHLDYQTLANPEDVKVYSMAEHKGNGQYTIDGFNILLKPR